MRPHLVLVTLLLELGARLMLFASVFALLAPAAGAGARPRDAAALALGASVFGFARTWWRARSLKDTMATLYGRLVAAVAGKSTPSLVANREHGQAAGLIDALYEVATVRAITIPDLAGSVLSLGVVLAVVAARLGPLWLGLGAAAALVVFGLFAPARRAARRIRERGWSAHITAAKLIETLIFGSLELRAAGRAGVMGRHLQREAAIVGVAERDGMRLGAVTAVLPALLALALMALPEAWLASVLGSRVAETALLAAVGATFALAIVANLEALVRAAPVRQTLNAFLGANRSVGWLADRAASDAVESERNAHRIDSITVRDLSVRYPGSDRETPSRLSFELTRGKGVALVGPNGGGKTTALMAVLGLVDVAGGAVSIDGRPPTAGDRPRSLLVPQRTFIVPDETIRWHVNLFGTLDAEASVIRAALGRVGLVERLASRALARGVHEEELPMGELSGGEQRRVAIARCLVHEAELVLVDEPEAGLDREGRDIVGKLLDELAREKLVLLVAHDPAVVPSSFDNVEVRQASVS